MRNLKSVLVLVYLQMGWPCPPWKVFLLYFITCFYVWLVWLGDLVVWVVDLRSVFSRSQIQIPAAALLSTTLGKFFTHTHTHTRASVIKQY